MNHEPKISLSEIIIITPYIVITDIIGIALFFFGLDDFFILDAIRFPITQLYLRLKGAKGTANLVSSMLELLPYVGVLPITTIGWAVTIYLDRNPEKAAAISGITGSAKKPPPKQTQTQRVPVKQSPTPEQELANA